LLPYQRGLVEFEEMNLNLKRSSLADVRLKIFIEIEADLEAPLLELRKRLRQASFIGPAE
jgi:hypothetical protein